MILLTKFSGEQMWVNPDMIKFLEPGGDTIVHLTNGDRLLVKETVEQICDAFLKYKKDIHSGALLQAQS